MQWTPKVARQLNHWHAEATGTTEQQERQTSEGRHSSREGKVRDESQNGLDERRISFGWIIYIYVLRPSNEHIFYSD